METTQNKDKFSVLKILRSGWVQLIALISIVFVLILVGLPYAMSFALQHWLLANGGQQVAIEDIDFNPFYGIARIEHLRVSVGERDSMVIPHLEMDLDWLPLLSRQIHVKAVTIEGVHLEVEETASGDLMIGGINLPEGTPETEPAADPWGYGVVQLEIKNSTVDYRAPDLQLKAGIHDLTLDELTTWATQPALLVFTGALNGADVQLDGQLPPLNAGYGYSGPLKISGLELAAFEKVSQPALAELGGQLFAESRIDVMQTPGGALDVTYDGPVRIAGLHLVQDDNNLAYEQLQWQGSVNLSRPESEAAISLNATGDLGGDGFSMELPAGGINLKHNHQAWKGEITYTDADERIRVGANGELSGAGFTLAMPEKGLDLQHNGQAWKGEVAVTAADERIRVDARGDLGGDGLVLAMSAEGIDLQHEKLAWGGELVYTGARDTFNLEGKGNLTGNGLALDLSHEGIDLQHGVLEWNGGFAVTDADDRIRVDVKGRLEGDGLALVMPSQGIDLRQGKLAWEGDAGVVTVGETADLQLDGKLKLESIALDQPEQKIRLANLEGVDIDSIRMQGLDTFNIDRLTLSGVTFARAIAADEGAGGKAPEVAVLAASSVTIDKIDFSEGGRLVIDTVEWRDVTSVEKRDKEGNWQVIRLVDTLPFVNRDKAAEAPARKSGEEKPGSVRVGTLRVTGKSKVIMEDLSVTPPFRLHYNITQASLRNIDSARPNQDSRVVLKGTVGKYGRIDIQGDLRPLATPVVLNLQGHFEGLDLPPFSPYIIAALGQELHSGALDADASLRIHSGQMEGDNNLTIRGLKVTPVKSEQLEKMQQQLSVPLDTALDMLRDDNNTIRLELPISGDLDHPGFDISDAINQAVARATKQAAKSFLILALQPYGTLITVAQIAGEAAAKVRLDPVVFNPASAVIGEDRFDYLDKVAGIMKERPNINIKLCSYAVEADRTVFQAQAASENAGKGKKKSEAVQEQQVIDDKQLLKLAEQRDIAVKDYMISKHSVSASRLVDCKPEIDRETAGKPRVDLLI